MQPEMFYQKVQEAIVLEPESRHQAFSALHTEVLAEYVNAVSTITEAKAESTSSDGRSIKQVVGHIMEWDRFMIQAAGEVLSGVQDPQMMHFKGFHPLLGITQDFESINAFNAYHAAEQAIQPWDQIQSRAISVAQILHRLFTRPRLLEAPLLDATAPVTIRFSGGIRLKSNLGWQLWIIVMEHEAVEHFADLTLG
jgi:hypothetical protein